MNAEPAALLTLLQICDLSKQWPALQSIHDLAMQDLVGAAADAKATLAKRKEVADKKAADEVAKIHAETEARNRDEAPKPASPAYVPNPVDVPPPNPPQVDRKA